MMIQLGYCCINTNLAGQGFTTGRTMRRATFESKGLAEVSRLALKNVEDILPILRWNASNNIWVFRMGSNCFPWNSEYVLSDLPDYPQIVSVLQETGTFIKSNGMRVTAHPDHFVKLASSNPQVVANSIHDLHHHDEIFNLMGLPANKKFCLNIHVGMSRSAEVSEAFRRSLDRLNDSTRQRLVVENDDKETGYSVKNLFDMLPHDIPITFDYFHHRFHTSGLSERDAAWLAYSTWGSFIPLFHYSESKQENEQVVCNPRAHADYVYTRLDPHDIGMDIDLEAKAKEQALLRYRELHPSLDYFSTPKHDY